MPWPRVCNAAAYAEQMSCPPLNLQIVLSTLSCIGRFGPRVCNVAAYAVKMSCRYGVRLLVENTTTECAKV